MTDTPAKTIQLKGEQWKQLALLHVAQLSQFLQGIPGSDPKTGLAGLTDAHLHQIDVHVQEAAMILGAWRRSRGPVMPQPEVPAQVETQEQHPGNGAAPPKKGGWPRGKKRTRQAPQQPAVTQ